MKPSSKSTFVKSFFEVYRSKRHVSFIHFLSRNPLPPIKNIFALNQSLLGLWDSGVSFGIFKTFFERRKGGNVSKLATALDLQTENNGLFLFHDLILITFSLNKLLSLQTLTYEDWFQSTAQLLTTIKTVNTD